MSCKLNKEIQITKKEERMHLKLYACTALFSFSNHTPNMLLYTSDSIEENGSIK